MTAALLGIAPTLAKLIRLLSSDRDGEVVASVHAMRRLLASIGLSLHDLADVIELPAYKTGFSNATRFHDDDPDWRVMAKACAQCRYLLSERERAFVATMARWRGKPSRKQRDWLEAIYDRVREAAA
jgi:hypothetical protein